MYFNPVISRLMEILVLAIFISCIVGVFSYVKDRISLFCILSFVLYWGISIFVSCFNPFDMKPNSNETYYLLLFGMLSFVLGFILFGFRTTILDTNINVNYLREKVQRLTGSKMLKLLYLFCTVFASEFMFTALVMSELNGETLTGDDRGEILFEGSYVYKFFYHFIMNPLYYITLSLLSVVILGRIKNRIVFCVLSILFIVASIVLSGGRSKFVIIIMYYIFSYVCLIPNIRKQLFKIKNMILSIVILLVMLLAMALQTGFRSTGTYSLTGDDFFENIKSMGETIGVYSVIPIRLFDYALNNYYFEKFDGPYYGRATLAGCDGIATGVVRRFSGIDNESTLKIVDYLQDNGIYIIPGKHPYNYCYTALFFCYMDYGIFGVIILPFVFGYILRYYISQLYKYSSLPAFIIVAFGYFMVMHSLFQNYFIKNWTIPFCLVMALWQYIFYTKGYKIKLLLEY